MLKIIDNVGQQSISIQKFDCGSFTEHHDFVAVEAPLEIRLKYFKKHEWLTTAISVTMRTPGQDTDLAIGFLFTESIIKSVDQIETFKIPEENIIEIVLKPDIKIEEESFKRNFYMTSSCGVCGKASIDSVKTENIFLPWSSHLKVKASVIIDLKQKLVTNQSLFNSTGGIHASALFDASGNQKLLREDVGRHNALDKLVGAYLSSASLPMSDFILMVSGRASFELVQKATMAGIALMVAVGAPSSLAVELAEEQGMTLVGFLKEKRFNIYARPDRIIT